jgi:hypothetical protein
LNRLLCLLLAHVQITPDFLPVVAQKAPLHNFFLNLRQFLDETIQHHNLRGIIHRTGPRTNIVKNSANFAPRFAPMVDCHAFENGDDPCAGISPHLAVR